MEKQEYNPQQQQSGYVGQQPQPQSEPNYPIQQQPQPTYQPVPEKQSYQQQQPHPPPQYNQLEGQHGEEGETNFDVGLCSCCGDMNSCCLAFCCPCLSFGRSSTYLNLERQDLLPDRNDMSSMCNATAGLYFLLVYASCGIGIGVWSTLRRIRFREKYQIEGHAATDCLKHFCCHCCALVQEDRTALHREERYRRQFDQSTAAAAHDIA